MTRDSALFFRRTVVQRSPRSDLVGDRFLSDRRWCSAVSPLLSSWFNSPPATAASGDSSGPILMILYVRVGGPEKKETSAQHLSPSVKETAKKPRLTKTWLQHCSAAEPRVAGTRNARSSS
ncbi:hypothetical protein RvY_18285 [Ramazzottius varieornatus]|uniref:Uncharacterized protein n=1 Tax=Ramazzottius varieornatus TaxID=947166 RepID=A0A1D1W560_RAMVA|nr:hypothetical protein RvY_18285 [Ramazzottius varieornatus]